MKTLVSFMGVARSGNFYSPIDTDMPVERAKRFWKYCGPVSSLPHMKRNRIWIYLNIKANVFIMKIFLLRRMINRWSGRRMAY